MSVSNAVAALRPEQSRLLTALDTYGCFGEATGPVRLYRCVVDDGPGVYVAWLTEQEAVDELGLSADAPLALYVGKAITGKGLSQRIDQHVGLTWLELVELLALQGRALSPFAGRVGRRAGEKHRREFDRMTALAQADARDWQHDNVSWSWVSTSRDQAPEVEREAIRLLKPVLNISEMTDAPPPLMREQINDDARAQWLWHMSWAGLFFGTRPATAATAKRWKLDDPEALYTADDLGYPLPVSSDQSGRAGIRRADCPAGHDLFRLFINAADDAPGAVRHVLGRGMRRDELQVWWAAHAAAPLLGEPVTVSDALAATLALVPAIDRHGPTELPTPDRCQDLCQLVKRLPRYRH